MGLQLLPNNLAGLFSHYPGPPARDFGDHVSGLVLRKILIISFLTFQVCLCSAHTNVKFAYEDAVSNCKRCGFPVPPYEHYVDLVESLLCPDFNRSRDCLKEECEECGLGKLDELTQQWRSESSEVTFKFRSVEKDDAGRLGVQIKEATPLEFAKHLKEKLRGFALHRATAKHQKEELDKHLSNLNPDTLVIVSDFAEKYLAKEWEEVQSLHWHGLLFTLFTSVAWFLVPDPDKGEMKKVKVYFGFFSKRPDQDRHMVAFCLRRIVLWIQEVFGLAFQRLTLGSDRCGEQFCSRKVFGAYAETRRNLCVHHKTAERLCPSCPQLSIHFTCAGHGKGEHDHDGALWKTEFRKQERFNHPLRNISDLAAIIESLNFVDLQRTPEGRQDSKGFFYSALHGEVVNPDSVDEPKADWDPIEHTRKLHQFHTTPVSGELLVREWSCFSCSKCEFGDFANCRRTEDLGPLKNVKMQRASSASVKAAKQTAKTRLSQEQQRYEVAELACQNSIIAIATGQRQELRLILITKARGEMEDKQLLKGKILKKVDGGSNYFTSTGAKLFSFEAAIIRSPPLAYETKAATVNKKKLTVYDIQDSDFQSLVAEYLF